MIPIKDDTPTYSTPFINYLLIALNTLIFLFEVSLNPATRNAFVFQFGVEPIRILAGLGLANVHVPNPSALPLLTSMFLHASWMHVIGNMWYLWIFGDNIEDRLGHARFIVFYLLCGITAALGQIVVDPSSTLPTIGASGAIAGVMGAYFLLFPSARVLTLVPLIIFFTFVWLPAWIVLGYWFVLQFLSGAATSIAYSSSTRGGGGGIAFWAHVGGFVAGVVMIKLLPKRMRQRSRYSY